MTCHEFHAYVEDRLWIDVLAKDDDVARHLAGCTACREFAAAHRGLGERLSLVRESVPQIRPSLDTAVLANYRRQITERHKSITQLRRFRPATILAWAAAAALGCAAVLFFARSKPIAKQNTANRASTILAAPPQVAKTHESPNLISEVVNPQIAKRHSARPVRRASDSPHSVAQSVSLPPEGFRSLMYCDELSCAGAMEMIRVQLPAAYVARPAAGFVRTGGAVTADVLVGPDGIARGIHIEE